MKSKILTRSLFFRLLIAMVKGCLIIGLIILAIVAMCKYSFSQSVPNTTTFSLQDVVNVTGGTSLDAAFTNSNAAYFDATYGSKTMSPKTLYGFRNYTVTSSCPSVGDSYQGGFVAYKFISGDNGYVSGECHGIIASNSDISSSMYYHMYQTGTTGATGVSIGSGLSNTNLINSLYYPETNAASICLNYSVVDGITYSDWFLPSKNELSAIFSVLPSGIYWSSTEYSNSMAWTSALSAVAKDYSCRVRAIRYF